MKDKKDIKPLLVSTYDIDIGAAKATYRLHKGLRNIGIDSKMLVQTKDSDDISVISPISRYSKLFGRIRPAIDSLPLKIYRRRQETAWGVSWLPNNIIKKIKAINPDVVHLHWVCGGFLPISDIAKIKYPIIWTLHGSWAFTGGCQIPYDCTRYVTKCGCCPQLGSKRSYDLSRWIWSRKYKYWRDLDLTIVTPSRWLYKCAKKSSLFKNTRIEIIPIGIDTNIFKPIDKKFAREILNLPEEKKLILYGAINFKRDKNKGFNYLKAAVKKLADYGLAKDIELLIFGSSGPLNNPGTGIKTHYLGIIHDEITLALIYSAADVMCVSSIQESFGQTAAESLSCGTPVVAFATTGLLDIINHKNNGYLAKPFDVGDFADGINWILTDKDRFEELSRNSREKVENEFKIEKVAESYMKLYKSLMIGIT